MHVPGLPLLSLIEVEKVTSKAVCEAGKKPVASANVLGTVTVLGKRVTLSAGGPTKVEVPGVGMVSLELSGTETTSTTAAAAALRLKVAVNPLNLNVAQVDGEIVLAEAHCESPKGSTPTTKAPEQPDIKTQTGTGTGGATAGSGTTAGSGGSGSGTTADANLAETGGGSLTPYITGGALTLLALGGGALFLTRRGRTQ